MFVLETKYFPEEVFSSAAFRSKRRLSGCFSAASCLEERLADLHFPAAADGRDLEVESDDWSPSPRSEETDSVSTSAFESYMRTLVSVQKLPPDPRMEACL